MPCAQTERFCLGRSKWRQRALITGHLTAALAVLHCSLPLAAGGLFALGISCWRLRRRAWPEELQRDAAGGWWLYRAGRQRRPARLAAGPVPGVISVTTTGQSEMLFGDAFRCGGQRRLRALLRHQSRAAA